MHASKPESSGPSGLRISVVISVLVVFAGLLVLVVAFSHAFHRPLLNAGTPSPNVSVASENASQNHRPAPSSPAIEKISAPVAALAASPAAAPNVVLASVRKQFSPVQHVSDLDDVMSGDRPESEKLGVALATLESPNAKLRGAALEAVRGLDDKDAIPHLEELAAQTDDADEKAALLDTADFLNLPSFTDYSAAHAPTKPADSTGSLPRLGSPPQNRNIPGQAR